jgi:drug/metabolite transporter (DMT)-like permease
MGALSHLAGERCDWRYVTAARTSLAFLFALGLTLSAGVRPVLFKPGLLWMRSIAGSTGLLCAFYALTHLPVSTALTLSNTVPVWVTLLAWPFLGQRPQAPVWAAVGVGLCGVVLVQRPDLSGGGSLAGALALFSALCTAVAMIGLNKLGRLDARAVVTHFSGVSTVFALVFLAATAGDNLSEAPRDPATLALLLGVGLTGTTGQIFMTRAFALGSPPRVAVVGLTQIVFALVYDLLLWRRPLDWPTAAGILLVAAPSAWLMLNDPLRKDAAVHVTG